jgi:hypothetical protein
MISNSESKFSIDTLWCASSEAHSFLESWTMVSLFVFSVLPGGRFAPLDESYVLSYAEFS